LMREHYRSAMVNVPFKSPTASVKFLWNISLDTFNPNGNRAQRYPNGDIIVVNRLDFSPSLTCQYASLQDDMKREIDKLVERNVLVPVTERTEWVSQMTVVRKSNDKLRICIDPHNGNFRHSNVFGLTSSLTCKIATPRSTFAIKRSLFTVIRPIFCTVLSQKSLISISM
jgi:hypothetical protein